MPTLGESTWPDVERLRKTLAEGEWPSVEAAAGVFARSFSTSFSDIALVRVFGVMPVSELPPKERDFARRFAPNDARFGPATRALTLLGTHGREAGWNDRRLSRGHLCIPLLDRAFVDAAPMIAKLLADTDVDLAAFDDGRPIATRKLLGGKNGMFYVPDALNTTDTKDRFVIADRAFVQQHAIRTVFGMGGAYLNGTLVMSIVFCTSLIPRMAVDRFPSLISNFKMATSRLVEERRIFSAEATV
jgi:hypothetical protein